MSGPDNGATPAVPLTGSLADLLRSVCDGVPMHNSRERIIAALDRYDYGYQTNDIESRVALFAPTMIFEDPVGFARASNHEELREFFRSAAGGILADRKVEDRIIIHDQAIERELIKVYTQDLAPAYIHLYTHFVFDPSGLIESYKVFFDRESVTT